MLIWWALEAKAETDRNAILRRFDDTGIWHLPIIEKFIAERIVQRYALAGGDANLLACSRLLRAAPDANSEDLVLTGLEKAFAGRAASKFPDALKNAVAEALKADTAGRHLSLGVRVGHPARWRPLFQSWPVKVPTRIAGWNCSVFSAKYRSRRQCRRCSKWYASRSFIRFESRR